MCAIVVITAAGLCPVGARATLLFPLSTTFNGAQPTSSPPYLTAIFSTVAPGTVHLSLTSSSLSDLAKNRRFLEFYVPLAAPSAIYHVILSTDS